MGEYNRKGKRSGSQASAHAKQQRHRREQARRPAKRVTGKSHHDGRVPDHKRGR